MAKKESWKGTGKGNLLKRFDVFVRRFPSLPAKYKLALIAPLAFLLLTALDIFSQVIFGAGFMGLFILLHAYPLWISAQILDLLGCKTWFCLVVVRTTFNTLILVVFYAVIGFLIGVIIDWFKGMGGPKMSKRK